MRARNPRAALAAIFAEGFFGRLAFGMLSFAFPLYALSLGVSLAQIGILVSVRSLLALLLKPAAGWLADRIGVRAVYMLGSLARTIAAAAMLITGSFMGLLLVRILQGASAAGRDVASLGVIARDAEKRIGVAYSWYASAKHVGGVAGAALAGIIIAASGGSYTPLLLVVAGLSLIPLLAASLGLREVADESQGAETHKLPVAPGADSWRDRLRPVFESLRELGGPASVGLLVAASAYMVHGIFPVLATEYVGLNEAQAGIIYSLSAVVFVVAGPVFGAITDRYGRVAGLAWRSLANIGSSILYMVAPSFAGLAAARALDDSGKAAFRPAWAAALAEIAAADRRRKGQRMGTLDAAGTAGEVIGPALAGILWQTGGIVALFGVRILIAAIAEVAAIRVFGDWRPRLPRPSAAATAVAYLLPPAIAFVVIAIWLGVMSGWGTQPILVADLVWSAGMMLLGILAGALAGRSAAAAEQQDHRRQQSEHLHVLRHDLRRSLTIIRGEVELILSRDEAPAALRRSSTESIIAEVELIDHLLRNRQTARLVDSAHGDGCAESGARS